MKLFRECTTEEILDLLGIETEAELPKLKEEKITLGDLKQKLINYLYCLDPKNYDKVETKILELLFNDVESLSSKELIKKINDYQSEVGQVLLIS